MKKLFILILTFLSLASYATHNRAGEITYRHLGGLSFEITVVTYTDPTKVAADRCELEIQYGDGDVDTINRSNDVNPCSQAINCDCQGEILVSGLVKKNMYVTQQTYRGPGVYQVTMEDPNRVEGIQNMAQSVNEPFYLKTELVISPVVGYNTSAILQFPPLDNGCIGQPYYHNPGALDPDGDSLSFELTKCLGANGRVATGYIFPNFTRNNGIVSQTGSLDIDPITGTVTWDAPILQGIYNLCILIKEWRLDEATGKYFKVGEVLRDMQIEVTTCLNTPPQFLDLPDLCVNAGDSLNQEIVAYDTSGEQITLTAVGLPFEVVNSTQAIFDQPFVAFDTVKGLFRWQTECAHIQKDAYIVHFKAEDNNPNLLVNFTSMIIRVVGPAPQNPRATNFKNSIEVAWDQGGCNNVSGYNIYRKIDSSNFIPGQCEIGVPAPLGFSLISSVGANTLSYVDDNNGNGLIHGQVYCYRIVAIYNDEVEGYSSVEVCAELDKDVPVITRVNVNTTSLSTGSDSISWAKPTQLDTSVQYPGPYRYRILRSTSRNGNYTQVGETPVFNRVSQGDTVFVDFNLNTVFEQYFYVVEMYSGNTKIGETSKASSVFLEVLPTDNGLFLNWDESVPWTNKSYIVYKEVGGTFIRIDTVDTNGYFDGGLTNGIEYTYFVQSVGSYSTTGFINPILNKSQVVSGIPEDTIKPCPPQNSIINSDCILGYNEITWENPNRTCTDDVVGYNIYFTPILGGEFELIDQKFSPLDTSILYENLASVAGCYTITAIDSFQNESDFSLRLCVDNCPEYELPSVFTPGGDGNNDLFRPFPYRYVESIDLKVYNRWGVLVFESLDPDILWDGKNMLNNKNLNSGVYFYHCVVNESRLNGIVPRTLTGNVSLFNQQEPGGPNN